MNINYLDSDFQPMCVRVGVKRSVAFELRDANERLKCCPMLLKTIPIPTDSGRVSHCRQIIKFFSVVVVWPTKRRFAMLSWRRRNALIGYRF